MAIGERERKGERARERERERERERKMSRAYGCAWKKRDIDD
jgi:hypothetical protein